MTSPDQVLAELRKQAKKTDEIGYSELWFCWFEWFANLDELMKSGRVPVEWDHSKKETKHV